MMETRKIGKRLLSAALAVAMAVTTTGTQVFASPEESGAQPATDTASQVLSWSWPEGSDVIWDEETQAWLLSCTYSEDQPLTQETLTQLLPAQVTAVVQTGVATSETAEEETSQPTATPNATATPQPSQTPAADDGMDAPGLTESATNESAAAADGNERQPQRKSAPTVATDEDAAEPATAEPQSLALDLTWDFSGLTFPLQTGEYTLTASLPETYQLAEGTTAVQLKLQVMPPIAMMANGIQTLADGKVINDAVSPVGTTINLFDYWTDVEGEDGSNYALYAGINKDHALKFSRANVDHLAELGKFNVYNSDQQLKQGIVQNTLQNGYPVLQENDRWDITSEDVESLGYLFDSSSKNGSGENYQDGKEVWENVKGLLQINDENYYYYDCKQDYAQFNKQTNEFTLYDKPDCQGYDENTVGGQFSPFNPYDDGENVITHYFGLSMTTRFVQQKGGKTDDGEVVTYEFSGDDDVWVFIDDVLVGDLGGIHGAVSLKIDFEYGDVLITDPNNKKVESNLRALYDKAGKSGTTSWSETRPNTFADDTYHTLKFFYLERGNGQSNMSLKFNLVSIPQSDLIKVDQTGDPVPGAKFDLYKASDDNYTLGERIATGTTDEKGSFVFTKTDGTLLSLNDLKTTYGSNSKFVLRELEVPDGYRTAGDVHLKFADTDQAILLSDNAWDTGAYAMPMLTATLPDKPQPDSNYFPGTSVPVPGTETGTFFAVVMKKEGDTWYPVSGDPIRGWTIHRPQGGGPVTMQEILDAAQKSQYIFQLDSSGSYKVTIDNLPGDIMSYYYMAADQNTAQYTVAYYYTPVKGLENAKNIVLLDSSKKKADEVGYFEREFAVRLYVPNIKNMLVVQKVDDNGEELTGAKFTLTKTQDENGDTVTDAAAQQVVTTSNLDPKKDGIDLDGAAVFPVEGQVLSNGTYTLEETEAPDGYAASSQETTIVVDNTGVYANAGEENDDVTVLRGAGNLVRSMVQFAEKDDVDTTLSDITATLYTSTGDALPNHGESIDTDYWDAWDKATSQDPINLSYENSTHILDYGLANGETGDTYFEVDAGWSSVKITQTTFNKDEEPLKEELINQDLSNLFSRSTIVRVKNTPIGLTIKKAVAGGTVTDSAAANQEFQFKVTKLQDSGNGTDSGYAANNVQLIAGDSRQNVKFNAGVSENIKISGVGSVTLNGLVAGRYKVEEITDPKPANITNGNSVNEWEKVTYKVGNDAAQEVSLDSTTTSATVTATNWYVVAYKTLTVTKTVGGEMGDKTRDFSFTLNVKDTNGTAYTGTLQYRTGTKGTEIDGSVPFDKNLTVDNQSKQYTFTLSDNDKIEIKIPYQYQVTVTEPAVNGYTTSSRQYASTTEENDKPKPTTESVQTINPMGTDYTVDFANECDMVPPTGLHGETRPYAAMVGLAGAAALLSIAGWVELRRRKRREQE